MLVILFELVSKILISKNKTIKKEQIKGKSN